LAYEGSIYASPPGRLTKWLGFTDTSFTIGDSEIIEDKFRNVGIGTTPTSKFTVAGMIQTTIGGIKFPDGTVQTTSVSGSLFSVAHDATLTGNGTSAAPLRVAVPLSLIGSLNSSVITGDNRGDGVGVLGFGGAGVQGVGGLISVTGQGGAVSGFNTVGLGVGGVEVSWQITGVRSDPVMRKHPFRVEEVKPEQERGLYLSPEVFDQPQEKGIDAVRARCSKQIGPVIEKAAARD